MTVTQHVAVMTREAMEALAPCTGGKYLDGTLGGGTHTAELLRLSEPDGHVLSLDVDPDAIHRGRERFFPYGSRWKGIEGNFRHLADIAQQENFVPLDGILLDLGLSSDLLADPHRGFSFQTEGPLDMRFGPQANEDGLRAAHIIHSWKEDELRSMLQTYGQERYARRIAHGIVQTRTSSRIMTTRQLADLIVSLTPRAYERGRIHPATRTFQALRIVVNDELQSLREAIDGAHGVLAPGGRLVIISFHSLEDRIVKGAFRSSEIFSPLFKKPLVPSAQEIHNNPRARSAKLRAAKKL